MTRRLAALVAVLLALAPLLLTQSAAQAVTPVPRPSPEHPVVVLGVPGLNWEQITADLPALDGLAHHGATGLLAGRGADEQTSTLDAWATLSAGNRARAHDLPEPSAVADPGVAVAQRQTRPARTGARIGALADGSRQDCVAADGGRGATLAAADSTGRLSSLHGLCTVRLIEAGDAAQAEAALRTWQARASLLIVVGLGDQDSSGRLVSPAHLNVAIASGPGFSDGRLTSGSTRRTPYVQLVDVAPTILGALGEPVPPAMIGEAMRVGDSKPFDRSAYLRTDERARFMPTAVVGVVIPLVVAFVLLLGLGALLSYRGRKDLGWRVALWDSRIVAATPVATFLARLLPYESWASSGMARLALLWALILAIDAVVLAACRLRIAWVAVVTMVVLCLDVLAGAPLQLHSVLGYSALIAGRFAGLGNPAFGAFAAAVLLTAMLAAGALSSGGGERRGVSERRPIRVAAVVVVGLIGVVVDGAPQLGSDVGGVLALVPAVALLAWAVAGRRIRVRTVLLAALAAIAVIVLFAALDLARAPESRTHLGRFASDLLNGRAGETLSRKAASNWALLTRNPATLLPPPLLAAYAVVLAYADRWRATAPLGRALQRQPALRAGLAASLITGLLGFAVNDSGVVVPAVMMLLVVPVAVEAAAAHRAGQETTSGASLASSTSADVP